MSTPSRESRPEPNEELARATSEIAERLRRRGVLVHPDDSPEDLVTLLESVEAFEVVVQSRGGDLMMDEPPRGHEAEPDDPHFVLPARSPAESAATFQTRLAIAIDAVRRHPPR